MAPAAEGGGRDVLPYGTQAFCARLVQEQCRGRRIRSHCDAVVCLFDLVGFSALCSRFTSEHAMEELSELVNSAFEEEISAIASFGGDVLSFSGDGLLAAWPVSPFFEDEEGYSDRDESPGLPLLAAAALELRASLAAGPLWFLSAGAGAGAAASAEVGGGPWAVLRSAAAPPAPSVPPEAAEPIENEDGTPVPGRMAFFVAGTPIVEAGDGLAAVEPGEVACCESVAALLPASLLGGKNAGRRLKPRRSTVYPKEDPNATPRTPAGGSARAQQPSGVSPTQRPSASGPSPSRPASFPALQGGTSPSERRVTSLLAPPHGSPSQRWLSASPQPRPSVSSASDLSGLQGPALAVDPSLLPRLAEHIRDLGFDSGTLAGALAWAAPPPPLTAEQEAAAACYVPYTVRARMGELAALGPGASPARLLSEFRAVSVLFAKIGQGALGDPSDPAVPFSAPAVRSAIRALQTRLYAREGSLRQVLMDDKGLVLIGVFGLYPVAHSDDPARCLLTAVEMREEMDAAGVEIHVGVTTGLAFCTFVGGPRRCEYAVFGSVVNLAARLMAKAESSASGVLADEPTARAAGGRVSTERAGEFPLKGFPGLTPAYRFLNFFVRRDIADAGVPSHAEGFGKSALARRAASAASEKGWRVVLASGADGDAAPLSAWRPVFSALYPGGLQEEAVPPACSQEDAKLLPALARALYIKSRGTETSASVQIAGIGGMYPGSAAEPSYSARVIPLPVGYTSRRMAGPVPPADALAASLRSLIVRLVLASAATGPPLLLLFEDADGYDSQSREALLQLARELPADQTARLLLVVTESGGPEWDDSAKPATDSTKAFRLSSAALDLSALADRRFDLRSLPPDDVAALARAHLSASTIPQAVLAFIAEESGGVPFLVRDVSERLLREGFIEVDSATHACTLLKALRIPKPSDALRAALLSRCDRLAPSELLTLKLASVVGMRCTAAEVTALHPMAAAAAPGGPASPSASSSAPASASSSQGDALGRVRADLRRLAHLGILREEGTDGSAYAFGLSSMREVAYALLPFGERRALHRRCPAPPRPAPPSGLACTP
eukprot:tig00020660_g12557.t1